MTTQHHQSRHGNAPGAAPDTDRGEDWRERAACATEDPDLFYPRDGESTESWSRRKPRALAVCGRCPVAGDCLAAGSKDMDLYLYGVWGGTTEADRARSMKPPYKQRSRR